MSSQTKANELLRVLRGERRKYTVRVFLPEGKEIEFQSDREASLVWNDSLRSNAVQTGYGNVCMVLPPDGVVLCEENPKE